MSPGIPCLLSPSFSPFTQVRSVGRLKRERSMSENAARQNGQLARNDSMWVERQCPGQNYSFFTYFHCFLSPNFFSQVIFCILWQVHNFKYYKANLFFNFCAFCLISQLICQVFSCSRWVGVFVGSQLVSPVITNSYFRRFFGFWTGIIFIFPQIFKKWSSLCIKIFPVLLLLLL